MRTRLFQHEEDKPVKIGESEPVGYHTARRELDNAVTGTRFKTLNSDGESIGNSVSIVVAEGVTREEVIEAFEECASPAPNDIRLNLSFNLFDIKRLQIIDRQITVGQKCMALAALDENIRWEQAESNNAN